MFKKHKCGSVHISNLTNRIDTINSKTIKLRKIVILDILIIVYVLEAIKKLHQLKQNNKNKTCHRHSSSIRIYQKYSHFRKVHIICFLNAREPEISS